MEDKLTEKNKEKIITELEVNPPKAGKKIFLAVGGMLIGAILVLLIGLGFGREIGEKEKLLAGSGQEVAPPTPTQVPFYEMTIPYLRERTYSSDLSALELVSRNSEYTSYLTSYDSDGLKINAQLTIPVEDRPLQGFPAIIFVHGYIPPPNYETLSNYNSYVDYLARSGFVVFKIDLRGHGNSEGDAGGAYYSSDYIVDILNARAALQNSEEVNPDAIGIWGHSMAGNVTLRAFASQPEIPAAVIWAGAVYTYEDWEEYGIQDGSYRPPANQSERQRQRDSLFETHGRFDKGSPFWVTVAATNYLKDLKGAIQLNHAVNDDVVNIGYSRNLAKLLEESEVEYELKEYSSGGHNITGSAFNEAMSNTVEFFRNHLR
jgi:dipeptidyl aminopeptidase/acylaminoacyl peptidase